MREKNKLYCWELALLLGVALALVMGTYLSGAQTALAGRVVRLHVVGATDSDYDQAVKLKVRDAVLAQAAPLLEGVKTQEEAQAILAAHLTELAQAGAAAAEGATVTATVEEKAWFPTKTYEDFALPAGHYPALKITLGEGMGRNWWCVVFPPLCTGAVTEPAAQRAGNFTPGQIGLITGESEGYVIKFKLLEWWDQIVERLALGK